MKYLLFLLLPIWPDIDWNAIYQALRHDTTMTGEGSDASPLKVDTTLVSTRAYANNIDAVKMFTNTSDATSHTVTMDGYSFKLIEGTNISLATLGTSDNGTCTISATGASLSDGDKGDVTVASGVIDIDAGVVGDNELGTGIDVTQLADGSVTSAELQYINSLTSNAQTQITARAVLAGSSGGQTLIGGTGTTDDLVLQTTSGVGATGAEFRLQGGNNGATRFMTVLNSGAIGINTITSPVTAYLELPGSQLNSSLKVGAFECQSYTVNNGWLSDNIYYANGLGFIARAAGFGCMSYYYNGAYQIRVAAASLSAGATFTPKIPLVINRNSSVSLGGDVAAGVGHAGANMIIDSIGKVGIGTSVADKKLEINLGTADALRLTYNDNNGSAANFMDATISSTGSPTFNATGTSPEFTFSDAVNVPDVAYGAGWNGNTEVATMNGVYDEMELRAPKASPTFTGTVTAPTIVSTTVVRLKNYTVATLPAGTQGDMAYVTDATAPTYLGALTGGGSVVCPVFYNGSAWVSH